MSVRGSLAGMLWAVACAAAFLLAPGEAAAQPGPLAFKACRSAQIFLPVTGIECGTLVVPFDRDDPAAGDIGLAVQRVPASGERKGVIVLLAGGPGQPGLPAFEEFLAPLAHDPALRGFELIGFDQRGTGQSQGLECPEVEGVSKGGISAYFGACGVALGATRGFYTSQESVEDLDALRGALDMPLSIWAVSYGTRVAGMYAREHPQGVARMVLDSTVPVSGTSALFSNRVRALHGMLDQGVCGAGACRSFTHDAYADLVRLVDIMHRHPLRARIRVAHGRSQRVKVTEAQFLSLLFTLDLAPTVREIVPAAIAAALHGDPAPLAQLTAGVHPESPGGESQAAAGVGPFARSLSDGRSPRAQTAASKPSPARAPLSDALISTALFAATYCVENQLPWSPESALSGRTAQMHAWLDSLPASMTAPFDPQTVASVSVLPWCLRWPATPAAPPAPEGISATSTLILSGDDDLRTPPEQAQAIAASYSDATLLRVPDVGHSTVTEDRTGCARHAMIQFLTTGGAPSSCHGSSEAQAVALPPSSLGHVQSGSRARLAGTVAAAAASALEYLFGQTVTSGGGLAGGYWSFTGRGLVVHDLSDTAGVALSGTIHLSGTTIAPVDSARLRLSGHISGELTLKGLALAGNLAGTPVHTRLGAL